MTAYLKPAHTTGPWAVSGNAHGWWVVREGDRDAVAEQLTEPQADAVASKLNELEERLDDARLSARINMDTITGMQKAGEPRARAIRSAIEVLEECDDYFDRRADADTIGDPPRVVGNREMHMLTDVRDALEKLRGAIK